ncbi:hypothetical protein JDV02_000213 [Purpureocillium takamizusanense]|uniref:Fe2OG dioxygenase domain-containing protein n=1 Tax=Purpureocillium takamizusanense TaxID=2060973 RepID=A0A9Q8Q5L0_9HYPO|nr:uncharacterized protein JDV02_000213 [Purpureocillium takamizusanense]UNI13470.1 hypothetical protein JDV02_000213 [Purpureocillium takamizusanense]
MATTAEVGNVSAAPEAETMQLRLASGNGPITRTIRRTPLRDASPSEIPLIDASPLFSDSLADRQGVARKMRDAATNNGFFYISDHGIPAEVTDSAHEACLGFFRQGMEVKTKTDANKGILHNGYRAPGTQRLNPAEGVDVREAYRIRYDPRMDPAVADPSSIPEHAAKYLHAPNSPWESTEKLPHFKESFVRYFQASLVLARALTRAFALSLGLDEDAFDDKVQYPNASFALNYYPPLPGGSDSSGGGGDKATATLAPGDPDARVSIGSHTDFQLFTILWQDDNGGLQVLNRQGQWIGARPVKGTFVVNIGDYMQHITNGLYVSTVHRVQNWSGRERVSIAFFWGFGLHDSCRVLDSCVAEGEENKYDEMRCIDWFNRRFENMLDLSEQK